MAYPTSLTLQQIFDLNEQERRRQAMERYAGEFEGLTGPEAVPSQSSMSMMDRLGLLGRVSQGRTYFQDAPEETFSALEDHPYTQTEGWETVGRGDAAGSRAVYDPTIDEVKMSAAIGSGADIRPGTQIHEPLHRAQDILRNQKGAESRFKEAGIYDFMFPEQPQSPHQLRGEWSPQAAHDVIFSQDPDERFSTLVRAETDPEKLRDVRREMNIMAAELPEEVWGGGLLTSGLPEKEVVEEPEMGFVSSIFKPRTETGVGADVTPTSLRQAQSMDKAYYLQDGEKKLAVTADQLSRFKKSDRYDSDSKKSALTQWANIAGKEGLSGLIPKKTIADVQKQKPANLTGNDKFITNWAKNYYTGEKQNDPKYLAEVESRLTAKVTKEASSAIAEAVKIFGTDKRTDGTRMTAELMRKTLEDIGKVESGYRTRIAGGGRPERGFWQVLPSTAKDALKNAKGYFGPKFNKKFAEYDGYAGLSKLSKKELSDLLEKDDALGAAFAAVQVLRTFDK
jgi:hypothetical protein